MTANPILPILLIVVIVMVVLLFVRKMKPAEGHYDELQLKNRAEGYKIGFFVTAAATLVLILLSEAFNGFFDNIEPSAAFLAALMVGIVTYAVYCIAKEAFFYVNDKGAAYMILCAAICAANVVPAVRSVKLMAGGAGFTFEYGSNLIMEASFLIILAAIAVKTLQSRKEADDE